MIVQPAAPLCVPFTVTQGTHHCSRCNRCVLKMDHHCSLTNTCVGLHNRSLDEASWLRKDWSHEPLKHVEPGQDGGRAYHKAMDFL